MSDDTDIFHASLGFLGRPVVKASLQGSTVFPAYTLRVMGHGSDMAPKDSLGVLLDPLTWCL